MGRKAIDRTGQRFGRLVAVRQVPKPKYYANRNAWWEFKCDCGNTCITSIKYAVLGRTKSCGCLRRENARNFQKRRTVQ